MSNTNRIPSELDEYESPGEDGQQAVVSRRVSQDLSLESICIWFPLSPHGRVTNRHCRSYERVRFGVDTA
jgi:hypothetical protein